MRVVRSMSSDWLHQLIESRGIDVEVVLPEDGPSDGFVQQAEVDVPESYVEMPAVLFRVVVEALYGLLDVFDVDIMPHLKKVPLLTNSGEKRKTAHFFEKSEKLVFFSGGYCKKARPVYIGVSQRKPSSLRPLRLDALEKRGKDQARPIKRYTCEWQDIELGDWSPR